MKKSLSLIFAIGCSYLAIWANLQPEWYWGVTAVWAVLLGTFTLVWAWSDGL